VLYSKTACKCHSPVPDRPCYLLTDFGFSRSVQGNGFSADRHGTDRYRAPELLKQKDFSDKTDIWAFGCLVMEVVSSGKCLAFENDYLALQYSEGKGGVKLPQLKPEDNKLLNTRTLAFFNTLLEECFCIVPKKRPSVEDLLFYLTRREILR
jgi:serine/threonine-protein kinase CLA4